MKQEEVQEVLTMQKLQLHVMFQYSDMLIEMCNRYLVTELHGDFANG